MQDTAGLNQKEYQYMLTHSDLNAHYQDHENMVTLMQNYR